MRRGFVIQIHSETDLFAAEFAGRVEHVDSGRADGFHSAEELVRFIQQTVRETEAAERDESQQTPADS